MKKQFTTIIPPPNLTGKLHIGHGLCLSIIDFFARCHKICGYDVRVLPGYDHGGISTENSANKDLNLNQNLSFQEKFNKIQAFANNFRDNITEQINKLDLLVDWKYTKYTLDPEHCKLVNHSFIELYNQGLIYRDYGLVNYDPVLKTSISDLEVNYEQKKGYLYYIPYFVDGEEILIATTRPVTMLGDTALFVNPNDERYKHLIGKKAKVPFTNRHIPILQDEYVDVNYGTGILKVTPAHDFNDYELYKKHNLDIINIFDEDLNISLKDHEFNGLNCQEVLSKIEHICQKKEPITHSVPYSSKTGATVEVMLMKQWFLKQSHIGEEIINNKSMRFIPDSWENTYIAWLKNLKDWCISRNISWGHRIPAWYDKNGNIKVSNESPGEQWQQTTEVLDTWFSSALWPIGYYKSYGIYPTTLLVTGYDIIFFWVARMSIMAQLLKYPMPFENIFIHQLVRDEKGEKMSKTRGNVKDPIEMCDKYSSDLFKFTMTSIVKPKGNVLFSEQKLLNHRNIITKLKNLHKFIENYDFKKPVQNNSDSSQIIAYFFIEKTNSLIDQFINNLEHYEIHKIIDNNKHFLYFLCDWMVEFTKIDSNLFNLLKNIYKKLLLLFYGSVPQLAEQLYKDMFDQDINGTLLEKMHIEQSHYENTKEQSLEEINNLMEFISLVRSLKNKNINLEIYNQEKYLDIIKHMCKIEHTNNHNAQIYGYKILIHKDNTHRLLEYANSFQEKIDTVNKFLCKVNDKTPQSVIDEKTNSLVYLKNTLASIDAILTTLVLDKS